MTALPARLLLVGLAAGLLVACGGEGVGWRPVAEDALSPVQQEQRRRAFAAKDAMSAALLGRLSGAMSRGGPARAIGVCRIAAPEIAELVGWQDDVAIGRTSFKLRNPANVPPPWARTFVADRTEENTYVAHPDGRLGAFLPIRLQNPCLTCHGPETSIPEVVRRALAEHYPDDEATGFARGDLRGWFWVEVPPPQSD